MPRSPRDSLSRFVNWAGTVVTEPLTWHEPATEDELCELVRAAAKAGKRIRAVGAGHSWSAIAAPDEIAVSLDRMSGVIAVDNDRATVHGGTRLLHLVEQLAAHDRTLSIFGSIVQQSIAGAIATGTHGSSLVHGNLTSLVESVRVIKADGACVDLPAAANLHLGALGIVTRVTLRVERRFRLAETVERVPLARAIAELEPLARSAEFAKIWWLPHTTHAHVVRYERTTDAPTWPSVEGIRRFDENFLHAHVFPRIVAFQSRRPHLIPKLNPLIARTFEHGRRVGSSPAMLTTPLPLLHRETEAALPVSRGGEALDRIARMIDRDSLHVNMPIEIRFVKRDDMWLSPAEGVDTVQIGAYQAGATGADRLFSSFWREMRAMSARPHWGKETDHQASELAPLFPGWAKFRALRDAHDPNRTFANAFHARTLGS